MLSGLFEMSCLWYVLQANIGDAFLIQLQTGQFYSASWWIQQADTTRLPSPSEIRTMLSDICANSDADVQFDKLTFSIT